MAVTIDVDSWTTTVPPSRSIVRSGLYWFAFYRSNNPDGKLYYESSTDGIVWGNKTAVTPSSVNYTNGFTASRYGDTNIIVAYALTADKDSYSRIGAVTDGTIVWGAAVKIRASGYAGRSYTIAVTTNRIFCTFTEYSAALNYYVRIFHSLDNGASWVPIYNSPSIGGYPPPVATTWWDDHDDGLLVVWAKQNLNYYNYITYDGAAFSGVLSMGAGTKFSNKQVWGCTSLVTGNGKSYLVYQKTTEVSAPIYYKSFTNVWGAESQVDASNCDNPNLAYDASGLYCFYLEGTSVLWRVMNLGTEIWGGENAFVAGETSPTSLTCQAYFIQCAIGNVWNGEAAAPHTVRYEGYASDDFACNAGNGAKAILMDGLIFIES